MKSLLGRGPGSTVRGQAGNRNSLCEFLCDSHMVWKYSFISPFSIRVPFGFSYRISQALQGTAEWEGMGSPGHPCPLLNIRWKL